VDAPIVEEPQEERRVATPPIPREATPPAPREATPPTPREATPPAKEDTPSANSSPKSPCINFHELQEEEDD